LDDIYEVDVEAWNDQPDTPLFTEWIKSPELQNHWAYKALCSCAHKTLWFGKRAAIVVILYQVWVLGTANCSVNDKVVCYGFGFIDQLSATAKAWLIKPLIENIGSFIKTYNPPLP
jgi:hypothetical protein